MKKTTMIFAVIAVMFSLSLFAQDAPRTKDKEGAKDYPGISRYKGAVIQEYNIINYTDFYLGLDKPVEKDFRGHGKFFNKYLAVKGKLYNNQYLIPIEEGIMKVYENYKNALTKAGYSILYEEHNQNKCFYSEDYYDYYGKGGFSKFTRDAYGFRCNDQDYYYIVVKGVRDSLDVYVNLFITEVGNYGKDFVSVFQSVIETVPLELGLVKADNIAQMELGLVKVDNIAQNIEKTGHSIFYDIHFATGSYKIDSKSDNQISEIAKYLKTHSNKRYYIVGHTDNVGNFSSNMTLSENRAKAVMNELITKYGVNAKQLGAYGVANLAPVTSNSTDKGKARNRRVEIVEQ